MKCGGACWEPKPFRRWFSSSSSSLFPKVRAGWRCADIRTAPCVCSAASTATGRKPPPNLRPSKRPSAAGRQWRLLLSKGIRTAVLVGAAIAILGQFMGVNAVLYYGPSIFERAGWSGSDSLFAQILVGAVNMLTTVLALAIIDRVGRKKLVYWGVSGMVLSLLLIGTCFLTGERSGMPDGVLLAAFLCYIFCCAISVCAVVWVLLSEMYPIRVRGAAMSIAGFALWVGTYLVGQLTPWMLANLTPAGTFFLFAAMCVPYMLLIWKAVPETSGRTLEEIERYWTR